MAKQRQTIAHFGVALTARTAGFRRGMKQAQTRIQRFTRAVRVATAALSKLKLALVAFGVGLAFKYLVNAIKRQAEFNAKLLDMQARLGFTVDELQAVRVATERMGVAWTNTSLALQRFVRRIGEAAANTGEARVAFKGLGIDAQKLAKQSPYESFLQVSDALKGMNNIFQRTSYAMKLLDIEGVDLARVMAQLGSKGFRGAGRDARRFGLATEDVAVVSKLARIAFVDLKFKVEGFVNSLTIVATKWITVWGDLTKTLQIDLPIAADVLDKWFRFVTLGFGVMADAIFAFRLAVAGAAQTFFTNIKNLLTLTRAAQQSPGLMAVIGRLPGGTLFTNAAFAISEKLSEWQQTIDAALEGVNELLTEFGDRSLTAGFDAAKKVIDDVDTSIRAATKDIKEMFKALGTGLGVPNPTAATGGPSRSGGIPEVLKAVSGIHVSRGYNLLGTKSRPMIVSDLAAQRRLDTMNLLLKRYGTFPSPVTVGP